jgi:hypothetical protein
MIDTQAMWNLLVENEVGFAASFSGKLASGLSGRFDGGDYTVEFLLCAYFSSLAAKVRPESGLTKVDGFHDYPNSENTLKAVGRIMGYHGLQNMPYMEKMADTLIKFREEMAWGGSLGLMRNMSEMCIWCAIYSDYRRDELREAVKTMAEKVPYYKTNRPYFDGVMIAADSLFNYNVAPEHRLYLHSSGTHFGLPLKSHLFLCPYGRWTNIEQRRPHEMISHPDYDYEKYGFEARNRELKKRIIYNKCSIIENDDWYYTTRPDDDFLTNPDTTGLNHGAPDYTAGKLTMKQIVNLQDTAGYENPFIKAAFKGTFNLYLNGTMIVSVVPDILIKEWGWCGFFIDDARRHSLKDGENVIAVEMTSSFPDSYVRVGLIDWR